MASIKHIQNKIDEAIKNIRADAALGDWPTVGFQLMMIDRYARENGYECTVRAIIIPDGDISKASVNMRLQKAGGRKIMAEKYDNLRTEKPNIYNIHGCETREEYLKYLSVEHGVSEELVLHLAELYGPSEDFDGLVNALADEECVNYIGGD